MLLPLYLVAAFLHTNLVGFKNYYNYYNCHVYDRLALWLFNFKPGVTWHYVRYHFH